MGEYPRAIRYDLQGFILFITHFIHCFQGFINMLSPAKNGSVLINLIYPQGYVADFVVLISVGYDYDYGIYYAYNKSLEEITNERLTKSRFERG